MFICQFFIFSYSKLLGVLRITKIYTYDNKKYSQFCNFSLLDKQIVLNVLIYVENH